MRSGRTVNSGAERTEAGWSGSGEPGSPPPETQRRIRLLARITLGWAVVLVLRLIYLQVIEHDEYSRAAQQQQERLVRIQPPRGAIIDRLGLRLAMSLPVDSVYVNPLLLKDPEIASGILAPILNLDQKELLERIRMSAAEHRGFLWVKRKITGEESLRLHQLKLDWIGITTEGQRFYPYKALAAHILGGVDPDEQGIDGIESKMNEALAGAAGYVRVSTDVQQRGFASTPAGAPAEAGADLHLTIDSRLQYVAEQAIQKAVIDHHCQNGSIVALDPQTGDILALANYPTFDPNLPLGPGDDKTARFDLAASVPFEPGSVFKVVTLSAALETTSLRPESMINCGNGSINLYGRVIHDDVHDHYSSLSMADVLAHSSNVGAINIGLKVGKDNLYAYVRKFGFGTRTGLPVPGESPGQVWPPQRWSPTSIGSVAMGHEISVTVLQLAQACSIIANGGFLVHPRLVAGGPPPDRRAVLRPETAITMRQMMEGVVLHGTGKLARLAGYTSGGKTGTAQIVDPVTHRYTHFHNSSFMGFAPVVNPRIVVVVSAHGATGAESYGAQVSAPAFAAVATAALRFLQVPPDVPEAAPAAGQERADASPLPSGDSVSSVPQPLVPAQSAAANSFAAAPAGDQRPFFQPASLSVNQATGPRVPDFRGKTMREVLEISASQGLPVEFDGAGLARDQAPAPGEVLASGQQVRVRFGR